MFEIRTYTTEPGKLPDLLKRFRDHTTKLFEKHGMTNIGYWVPTDEPRSKNTLIYILAHASRDAAKKSWDGFQHDPDWIKVRNASEANGKIVTKVESIYAEPTDVNVVIVPSIDGNFEPSCAEMIPFEKQFQTLHSLQNYLLLNELLAPGFAMPMVDTDQLREARVDFVRRFAERPYVFIRAATPQVLLDEMDRVL